MANPIPAVTLPLCPDLEAEAAWLQTALGAWLDQEYLPEPINQAIAARAAQVYLRQRLEGEHDLGSIVIALVTEMQMFDFSHSFYSEFAIANAVSDLLIKRLGIDSCCGSA